MSDNYSFDFSTLDAPEDNYSYTGSPTHQPTHGRRGWQGRDSYTSTNVSFDYGSISHFATVGVGGDRPENRLHRGDDGGQSTGRYDFVNREMPGPQGTSDDRNHPPSPVGSPELSFLDGVMDGTFMPPSEQRTTRRKPSEAAFSPLLGHNTATTSGFSAGSGGDNASFSIDLGNQALVTLTNSSRQQQQEEASTVSTAGAAAKPDAKGYEDEVMYIISETYKAEEAQAMRATEEEGGGKRGKTTTPTPSTSKSTLRTGPLPWPSPPPRPHRAEQIFTTDRNGTTSSLTTDASLHATPKSLDPSPPPPPPGPAKKSAAATARSPTGRADTATTPAESRFSPELVALTVSGMNLAQMRKVAKDLHIDLGLNNSHNSPTTTSSRTTISTNRVADDDGNNAKVNSGDDADGAKDGAGLGVGGEGSYFSTTSGSGKRGTAAGAFKGAFPHSPGTAKSAEDSGYSVHNGTLVASPTGDRPSGPYPQQKGQKQPAAMPQRRRWSDETNNSTRKTPKQNVSPPPRTPQQTAGSTSNGERPRVASEPVLATTAMQSNNSSTSNRGRDDDGDDDGGGGYDYGFGREKRTNSAPSYKFAKGLFGADRDTAPSQLAETSKGTATQLRPRSSRKTPTAVLSPFPSNPITTTTTGGGGAAAVEPLPVFSPKDKNKTSDRSPSSAERKRGNNSSVANEDQDESSLSGSGSLSRVSASGRFQRPKPAASRQKGPTVLPDIHAEARTQAKSSMRSSSSTNGSNSNGPSSTTSSPSPTPTASNRKSANAESTTIAPWPDAEVPTIAPPPPPPNGKGQSPRKVTTLPAIPAHKAPLTNGTLEGKKSPASTGHSPATTTIAAGGGKSSSGSSPGSAKRGSGTLKRNKDGTAPSSTAGLLPPPAPRTSILERRRVYIAGADPEKRRRYPRRRSLPNGKRRANWTAPETHYITCLSTAFDYGDDDDDTGDEMVAKLLHMQNPVEQQQQQPQTQAASPSQEPHARPAGGAVSPLPHGPSSSSGRTTPLDDGEGSGLVVDEVEKLRRQRRLRGQYNDESPLSGSLTSMGSPLAKPGGGQDGPGSPFAAGDAAGGRPANRPSSRNSDNHCGNASFDLSNYTFLPVSRKNPSSVSRPLSVNNRGSESSVTSGSVGNRNKGVVSFAEDTVYYEVYSEGALDDDFDELDNAELGSGEVAQMDA